jgi:dTDP-4-dehydrorhamnose reductase
VDVQTILVTGASGLLGANLALILADAGFRVAAVSNRWALREDRIRSVCADLDRPGEPERIVRWAGPDWIIHCAALTNLDECENYPGNAARTNTEMSGSLAEAAALIGARFIYISTDSVFDGTRGDYAEDAAPSPLNQYASSKLRGEEAVREVLPDALVVRVNIFGWNAQPKLSLAEWILEKLEQGQELTGYQDVVFNPLLVNDLGELLIRMMRRPLSGLMHVGSTDCWSKYEFSRAIARAFGHDAGLVLPGTLQDLPARTLRPKNTTLRSDRVRAELGVTMPGLWDSLMRFRRFREDGSLNRLRALLGRGTHDEDQAR